MRRLTRTLGAALMAATFAAASATSAVAQEEGVTIDPDSPAAKEYALPHEEARRETGGKEKKKTTQGTRDSSSFGEGVTPDAAPQTQQPVPDASTSTGSTNTGTEAKPKAEKKKAKPKAKKKKRAEKAEPSTPTTPVETTPPPVDTTDTSGPATTEKADSGIGGTTALLGGGALALVAAGLGGLGLRRAAQRREAQ